MISTIIINYNCFKQTHLSLSSVLDEVDEVIVVDNSESNEEFENLKSFKNDRVVYIKNQKNVGFAKACNYAYSCSEGDYLLFLNPDAYFVKGSVTLLKNFLEKSDAAAAGPKMFWDSEKKYYLPPTIFPNFLHNLKISFMQKNKFYYDYYIKKYRKNFLKLINSTSPLKQNALSGGHFMIKRKAVEKLGYLFDERFFMYYEDSDLMFRLKKNKLRVYIEPKAEVIHNHLLNSNKNELMIVSGRLYFNKHYSEKIIALLNKLQSSNKSLLKYECLGEIKDNILNFKDKNDLFFEFSPVNYYVPSIISYVGRENSLFSNEVWDFLSAGKYFFRFFDSNTLKTVGENYSFIK